MCTIERDMMRAIWDKRPFHRRGKHGMDGTRVVILEHFNQAQIYLHNNRIATYNYTTSTAEPNLQAFLDWPTTTTCSRLKALGIGAHIKNYEAHIDDVPVRQLLTS